MIAYEELVSALAIWRERNGLPVGSADYLGAPPVPSPISFESEADQGDERSADVDVVDDPYAASDDLYAANDGGPALDYISEESGTVDIGTDDDAILAEEDIAALARDDGAYANVAEADHAEPTVAGRYDEVDDEVAFISSAAPTDDAPAAAERDYSDSFSDSNYPAIDATAQGIPPAPPPAPAELDESDFPPVEGDPTMDAFRPLEPDDE